MMGVYQLQTSLLSSYCDSVVERAPNATADDITLSLHLGLAGKRSRA